MQRINRLAILCGVFLLSTMIMPETAPAQSKFPSLKELRQTNVALKILGFQFASGLRPKANGRPNGSGYELLDSEWGGSGFIVRADGSVVTNYHVARRALRGFAKFEDGSSYEIRHIRTYLPSRDLAILKIAANRQFPAVKMGNTNYVQPMDTVLAVGNPLQGGISMTKGEVSRIDKDDNGNVANIVHTAAIAPGSSGGALYKEEYVVGVNSSASLSRYGATDFNNAIPIEIPKYLLNKYGSKSAPLTSCFPPQPKQIAAKRKQVDAVKATVPAAQGKSKPGFYRFQFVFYQLEDYCIMLSSPGRDLAINVFGVEPNGKLSLLGIGDYRQMGDDGVFISSMKNQRVLIDVVNYDAQPANFGLQISYINW